MRSDIHGLRAIAVIAVITNHYSSYLLPSGFLGVDVFFVISGYVITSSILRRDKNNIFKFLIEFYADRFKRLGPAIIFFAIISSLIICSINENPAFSLITGIYFILGISNIFLWINSLDYFSPNAQSNIFTHTWSLGVEEQFYLIYPLLFIFLYKHNKYQQYLKYILLFFSFLSLLLFIYFEYLKLNAAFYLMPLRFWELGIGCIMCFVPYKRNIKPLVNTIIFTGIITLFTMPIKYSTFSTISVSLLSAVFVWNQNNNKFILLLLELKSVAFIGTISFSLYLYHWTFLTAARWTIGIDEKSIPILVLLTVIFAYASYTFLERPFKNKLQNINDFRVLLFGFFLLGLTFLFIKTSTIYSNQIFQFWNNININEFNNYNQPLETLNSTPHKVPKYVDKFNQVKILNSDPISAYDSADQKIRTLLDDCKIFPENSKTQIIQLFERCSIISKSKNGKMIWMLGDSHAAHHAQLLDLLHNLNGYGVSLVETPGIPYPIPIGYKSSGAETVFENIIKKSNKGDIILISRLYLMRNDRSPMINIEYWGDQLEKLANEIKQYDLTLIVMGPLPMFEFIDVNFCRNNLLKNAQCQTDRSALLDSINLSTKPLLEAANKSDNIYIFNQFDILCPPTQLKCSPLKNGKLLYRDRDHLSNEGSHFLYTPFVFFLKDNKLLN